MTQPTVGGVSSIVIEGDQAAGQIYVPRAQKLLRRLVERMNLGGVQTASDFVRLDDTAYCYGIVSHAVQKAIIVVEGSREEQTPALPPAVVPQVPDFYSGAVMGGTIPEPPVTTPPTPRALANFWPTPACAALFELNTGLQTTPKLAVEPADEFAGDLGPPENYQGPTFSQYVKLKPTMYSGAMRWVVQLLMGFGRQAKKSLYDRTKPDIGTIRDRKKATLQPTAYQKQVQKDGLQIRYDWRWHRTHGIARGADGELWLVEIGTTRGVLAMRLPMNETSQLTEFRQKLEDMGDGAGLYALDHLGGFPTGEGFPATAMDSWIRAGRVLQLATTDDMDAFYQHGTFSSVLGWAFNDSGTEAHNTCVSYDDDFFQTAYHYAMFFNIGALVEIDPQPDASALKARFNAQQGDDRYQAVMWKIGRLSRSQTREFLERGGAVSFIFDDLDALVLDPQAPGSANLSLQESGRLYKLGRLAQYDLKFPSPELGYLVSWDMQPGISVARFHGRCDTTVHVFFDGDQLKYVRFFNDQQTVPWETVDDDSDGCKLMGTFTRTEEHGTLGLPIMVYSNDIDDRDRLASSRSVVVGVGTYMGYARATVADDIIYPPSGHLSRVARFKYFTDSKSWSGEGLSSAMVVPFYDRCAFLYAKGYSKQAYSHSTSYQYKELGDPWSCDTWRNFPGYTGHYAGDINNGHWITLAQHPDGCGPVTARTVRAPGAYYSSNGPCSDFADKGPWCNTCDNAESLVYTIPPPPLPPSTNVTDNNTVEITSWIVNASGLTPLKIAVKNKPAISAANPWFIMSPDPETNLTQYAEATNNAFGDSPVMRYYDQPNGSVLTRGGPQPPGFTGNTTFVGVV